MNKRKLQITKERDNIQSKVDKINANAKKNGWSDAQRNKQIGDLGNDLSSLNTTLGNLDNLEASSQVYALYQDSQLTEGVTSFDAVTHKIIFSFSSTSNFIHETTHGAQFEAGEFGYSMLNGDVTGIDVLDEIQAYKAQYAFDKSSVTALSSTSIVKASSDITSQWVQGITNSAGVNVYGSGGIANTGLIHVNLSSNGATLIQAYPNQASRINPSLHSVRDIPFLYYKH